MLKLCIAIVGSDFSELEMLAPHLTMFTMFRTDTVAYPVNAGISHLFRGAQVLLLNQESDSPEKMQEALRCFSEEATKVENEQMRASTDVLVYSKLLLQTSKGGMAANFTGVIGKLDLLLENEKSVLPSESVDGLKALDERGISTIGFMF